MGLFGLKKKHVKPYQICLCFVLTCFGILKKYLDEAEEDKKRYIEELKIYQQSEQYQAFMKRQSAKKIKTIVGKPRSIKKKIFLNM